MKNKYTALALNRLCDCGVPVGSNDSAVDLKPFKPAVTCVIPADLNLVVAVFDQRCALPPLCETR